MEFKIAKRLQRVEQSPSIVAAQRARELRAAGRDIVALSTGEPDFPTPAHIIDAAAAAARKGETKYTAIAGTLELRTALAAKLKRENGVTYTTDEVMISTGGKQAIFNAIVATMEAGDEAVIPAPFWIAYSDTVLYAGATPVVVRCPAETGFKITPAMLERAITPATRWLVLNSPSNPSGAVYTREEYLGLAEVLRRHPNVAVMVDEMYEHIVFDGHRCDSFVAVCPDMKDRSVIINGVSKTYSMTGWRIGFTAAPAALIKEMTKLQAQVTSGPSSVGQAAALAALTGPQESVEAYRAAFEERRDLVVSMLNQAKGITCVKPAGAFYAFPSCAGLIGKRTPDGKVIETDRDFVMYLMDGEGVAAVHGAAYGVSPHFRLSFAASTEDITRACERIQRACAALR
jgi:aspartate aminotransferase